METGLVPLRVPPDQAGCVGKLTEESEFRFSVLLDEQSIELCLKRVPTAHQLDQAGDVLLYVECIEPGVDLSELVASAPPATELRIKRFNPFAALSRGAIKPIAGLLTFL